MGLEQLESFKAGLRKTESGSWEGDPNHRGNWRDGDGEVGAYGVRASNFAFWANEIGLAGADWRDEDAMEQVITKKLTEYYNTYGDWDLVSMAWIGGTDLADAVQDDPVARNTNAYLGKTVGQMAELLTTNMDNAPEGVTGVPAAPEYMPYVPGTKKRTEMTPNEVDAKTQLVSLFDSWGTDLAGGQRQDYRQIGAPEGGSDGDTA